MRAASAVLLGVLCCAGAADAQEFGPGDIGRLAEMKIDNAARFKASVVDVGRFSGTGTVRSTGRGQGTYVSMPQGEVVCQAEAPGVAAGDRVQVAGVIGDAMTASAAARFNRIGKALGDGNSAAALPEVPSLSLLTDNCAVRKAR